MSVHCGLPLSVQNVHQWTMVLESAPFVGAPPQGALPHNPALTGLSLDDRPSTQTRFVYGTRTDHVSSKSVLADTVVSCVEAQRAPSPVVTALASPGQPQNLNYDYWHHALFEVYEAEHAHRVLAMLADGVRIGHSGATEVIVSPNWPSAFDHGAKVSEVVSKDLEMGHLHGPFTNPPYQAYIVSPLGAIKKKDSEKIRLIHDLSYPARGSVNSSIDPSEFSLKYASIDDAVAFCNNFSDNPPFMAKLDLQDAFKLIRIHPEDWHLMGFSWPDGGGSTQFYFSKVLSFGLRSAPALFDVFASALLQFMMSNGAPSTIVRYVDDFLIIAPDAVSCRDGLTIMLETCAHAGFPVQPSKVTSPATEVKFLGISIDSVARTLSIDKDRLDEVIDLVNQLLALRSVTKRRLLSVIGKLAFASRVVRTGRAFLGRLIDATKTTEYLHYSVKLTRPVKADLRWWRDSVRSHNGVSMIPHPWADHSALNVFTDASDLGMGGYFHPDWFYSPYLASLAPARGYSINWRELYAAVSALATWGPQLAGKNVYFHIDNQAVVAVLKKHYSPAPHIMALVRTWCLLIVRYDVNPRPIYIPTDDNVDADDLSRMKIASFQDRRPTASPHPTWPLLLPFSDQDDPI